MVRVPLTQAITVQCSELWILIKSRAVKVYRWAMKEERKWIVLSVGAATVVLIMLVVMILSSF